MISNAVETEGEEVQIARVTAQPGQEWTAMVKG